MAAAASGSANVGWRVSRLAGTSFVLDALERALYERCPFHGKWLVHQDHHYMERFGAALLLSALDAGVSLGQAELSKGSTTNLNFGSVGGGNSISSLTQQILQSQISIPPTISVPPGAIVSIVVDHPVDFSDAIKVAAR